MTRVVTEVENLHARLSSIRGVVRALPRANFDLLKRVAEHLDKYVFFVLGTIAHSTYCCTPESPTLRSRTT